MKPLFLVLLLSSGCTAAKADYIRYKIDCWCSPDGVAYWKSTGSLTPRINQDGKVIPCQP